MGTFEKLAAGVPLGRITQRHRKWLADGAVVTPEAVERVTNLIRSDYTNRSRKDDGSGRFRPSMIGDKCDRKQWLSFMGYPSEPPSPTLRTIFDIGTWSHYRWQMWGLSEGWLADIEVPVSTDYSVSGSADGITDDGAVFEFKTTNPRTFAQITKGHENVPLDAHVQQVHAYMDAVNTTRAVILYEEKSFGQFAECEVFYDSKIAEVMRHRCESMPHNEPTPLPDCMRNTGSAYHDCAFRKSCRPEEWL